MCRVYECVVYKGEVSYNFCVFCNDVVVGFVGEFFFYCRFLLLLFGMLYYGGDQYYDFVKDFMVKFVKLMCWCFGNINIFSCVVQIGLKCVVDNIEVVGYQVESC